MYVKLSLRNIKRSIKDYGIYFITITLAIAFMYSFLTLAFSDGIQALSDNMHSFTYMILFLSIIITFLIAFTVRYSNRFIVEKRKKEFAVYLLLGMERRLLRNMFCIENGIIGILAFGVGIVTGSLLSQIFTVSIMKLFEVSFRFEPAVTMKPVLFAFLCFLIMYGINIIKTGKIINKMPVVEMLYSTRFNEKSQYKKAYNYIISVLVSCFLIILAAFLLKTGMGRSDNGALIYLFIALVLIIVGILVIYKSIPGLFYIFGTSKRKWMLTGMNLIMFRQLTSKLNTTGKTMGVMAILLSIALSGMCFGLSLGEMYKINIKAEAPFDEGIAIDVPGIKNFEDVVQFVDHIIPVKDYVDYQLYEDKGIPGEDILLLSDYNRLREQLGLDRKKLAQNQYLIHCDTWSEMKYIEKNFIERSGILIQGSRLVTDKALVFTEAFEQSRLNGSKGYSIVVPDTMKQKLIPVKSRLVITNEKEADQSLKGELNKFIRYNWKPQFYKALPNNKKITISISVKAWSVANGLTALSMLSFGGLYVCLTVIILVGTLIALQQLSDMDKRRYQFEVLYKIGVDNEKIEKLLFREMLILYSIPLVIPVIILISSSILANYYVGRYILEQNVILRYSAFTLLLFLIIYTVYFIFTYRIYKITSIYNK